MSRVLVIFENSYGLHHPSLAAAMNIFANVYMSTDRLAEAELQKRRALEIDGSSYGPDHPSVARDLNSLAQLLRATDRLGEAEPLMRRALMILIQFTKRTGREAPATACCLGELRGTA